MTQRAGVSIEIGGIFLDAAAFVPFRVFLEAYEEERRMFGYWYGKLPEAAASMA